MRVLITGCHGQVGSSLTQKLSQRIDTEVLALDKEHLDITNRDAVFVTVQEFKPTVIINAAAYTAVDKAEEQIDLSYAINRDGPKFLAEAAQAVGAAIFHISTDYVFKGNKAGEYIESDAVNPQCVYGLSKLAGETEVAQACDKHIILRTAWVFSETGNNFVKTMLRLGARRDELGIVADQFGGPTYAGDIANALIKIAQRFKKESDVESGVYHFSGLPHVSWFEFAEAIFDQANNQRIVSKKPTLNSLTTEQFATQAKRPSNSKLCTKKILKTFSIEASDWMNALENIKAYSEERNASN